MKTLKSENPNLSVGKLLGDNLYTVTVLSMIVACIILYALIETDTIGYILR